VSSLRFLPAAEEQHSQFLSLPVTIDPESLQPVEGATLTVEALPGDEESVGVLILSIKVTNYVAETNYYDVLLEVRSALPGLAYDDWDVVPAAGEHSDPCWWVEVDTAWMARYREAVGSRGIEVLVTSPPDLTDDPDGLAQIVPGRGLTKAIIEGKAVRAICGHRFVSSRNPDDREFCPACIQGLEMCERMLGDATTPPDE
jgi:hypothetical protein